MTTFRKLPGKAVRTRATDIKRFKELSPRICDRPLSDVGARAGAVTLAGMRTFQRETGPGYAAFELIASVVPLEYKKNWAKNHLGLVERR
ncbi:MAG: hypothetical protein RO009_06925 [Pseudorhodoplanes sp.]|jgi:hypothetical protein|nr:hypothetical protein [Pseudorhodoplanes sp.]